MKPDIFNYLDYRKYLSDYYAWAKSTRPFFSYQYMAMKAGMDTSNLAKVLTGKCHVPEKVEGKFRTICDFNEQEQEYFQIMVQWAKAKNENQAALLLEKLRRLHS